MSDRFDPDRLCERLADDLREVGSGAGGRRVELYARLSTRLRVTVEPDGSRRVDRGTDAGIAARVLQPRRRRVGFGAASGFGRDAAATAVALACDSETDAPAGRPWSPVEGRSRDHDPAGPTLSEDALVPKLAGRSPSWIEVARTCEILAADGGVRTTRVRNRAWAMTWVRVAGPGGDEDRPLLRAARSLESMPEDVGAPPAASGPAAPMPRGLPWLLDPEPSATLVQALVTTLCDRDHARATPVGPGLRIREIPDDPRTLAGGRFDDAGFAAKAAILADGQRTAPVSPGPGRLRRSSFRDPPGPVLTAPVVAESGEEPPGRYVRVIHLRVHRMGGGRWVLALAGNVVRDGEPELVFPVTHLAAEPAEIARRCVATVGPSWSGVNGVVTPSLLIARAGRRG